MPASKTRTYFTCFPSCRKILGAITKRLVIKESLTLHYYIHLFLLIPYKFMGDSVFINTFVLGWWVATQPKVDMGEKLGITVAEIQPLYASIVSLSVEKAFAWRASYSI